LKACRLQGKPQHKVIASPSSPFFSVHIVFHHHQQQLRGHSLVLPRHQHQILHQSHQQPYDLPNNDADNDLDNDGGGSFHNGDAGDDG